MKKCVKWVGRITLSITDICSDMCVNLLFLFYRAYRKKWSHWPISIALLKCFTKHFWHFWLNKLETSCWVWGGSIQYLSKVYNLLRKWYIKGDKSIRDGGDFFFTTCKGRISQKRGLNIKKRWTLHWSAITDLAFSKNIQKNMHFCYELCKIRKT